MKKSLVLAMAMALGVTASAYAANPFSDVPAGHWAYDSVAKLAAAGVVDGYVDGTYGGDKLITRYEMAQIVAKAMAKGANVDKLAAEFADELDTLGVRVAKLEKGADAVKITGEVRYAYADHEKTTGYDADTSSYNYNKLRSRIWFAGQVNDDWTYTGMIQNEQDFDNDNGEEGDTKFQRAYLDGKVGGLKVRGGRYNLQLGDKNVYDHRFDGIQATYGKDVKLTVGAGKAANGNGTHIADEAMYAEVATKVGVIDVMAGYYSFDQASVGAGTYDIVVAPTVAPNMNVTITNQKPGKANNIFGGNYIVKDATYDKTEMDKEIWAVGATLPVAKNLKLGAIYLMGDDQGTGIDEDGYVATLSYKGAKATQPGSWGLTAKYYDQSAATYVEHTMDGLADDLELFNNIGSEGFKGYSLVADYALAKNIVAKLQWYDLEAKEGENDAETLWGQVVFTF